MYFAELYDSTKEYYFQDGKIADYQTIKSLFPVVDNAPFIVFTDYKRKIIISFELLDLKRTEFNVPSEYTNEQAVQEILSKLNRVTPQSVEDVTRIADALEDLVVLNMPDEEE